MSDPLLYLAAVLALLAAPGPTNALLAVAGASSGFVRSLPLIAAEAAAYLLAVGVLGLVVAPLLADQRWLAIALKIAVAGYLIWLSIRMWQRGAPQADGNRQVGTIDVFVATLLNPKGLVLALGMMPWGHAMLGWYVAGLATAIVVTGAAWTAGGVAVSALAGHHGRLIPRVGSVTLAGFAGLLLASAFG